MCIILLWLRSSRIKKIILLSTPEQSFVLWCFTGLLFSFILMILFRKKFEVLGRSDLGKCLMVAFCFGIMQLSTNFVFLKLNVGLSLALFQLSTIVSVLFGYKFSMKITCWKRLLVLWLWLVVVAWFCCCKNFLLFEKMSLFALPRICLRTRARWR